MGAPLHLQIPEDGAALICFTSGTSGPPKGVIISHTALHCQVNLQINDVGRLGSIGEHGPAMSVSHEQHLSFFTWSHVNADEEQKVLEISWCC